MALLKKYDDRYNLGKERSLKIPELRKEMG